MASLADQVRTVSKLLREHKRGEIDRREFITLTASMSAVAIAAACSFPGGGGGSSNTSGVVKVPFYTTENDPGTLAFLVSAISEFNQTHPHVTVPVNLYSDQLADTFISNAFKSKHDVGVFSPNIRDIPAWANANLILPIDDIVKSVGPDDFFLGTRIQLNGHDWSMPWQKSVSVCWVRKDILAQVGVNTYPTNYDDWVSVLKMVHGRNGMIGMSGGVGSDTPEVGLWCMHPYILQSGWSYFDHTGAVTWTQPDVFDGFSRFVNVTKNYGSKDLLNATFGDLLNVFVAGKSVFAHYTGRIAANVWQGAPNLKGKIDVMSAEPGGPFMTGKLNMTFPKGYCIDANTQSPTDALDFVKFITTGDRAVGYALTVPGQPMPPLKSVMKSFLDPTNKTVQANALMADKDFFAIVQKLGDYVDSASSEETQMGSVNNKVYKPISNVMPWSGDVWKTNPPDGTAVAQIILQGKDVKQAWTEAGTAMKTAADNFKKANPKWTPAA
jgi:ABC-type glycerol-3-phosphate transport system substrate-binding protein